MSAPVTIAFDCEWVGRVDRVRKRRYNHILNYAVVVECAGRQTKFIYYTTGPSKRHRLTIGGLIDRALRRALSEGTIEEWPDRVTMVGHFLRADLAAHRDFWAHKRQFQGFGKTFTGTGLLFSLDDDGAGAQTSERGKPRRSQCVFVDGKAKRRVIVRFVDTMLLTPGRGSLETAAQLLGMSKVALPEGYAIHEMDRLLKENRAAFEAYALQDALIALLYYLRIRDLAAQCGLQRMPATLAAFAIAIARREIKKAGISLDEALGVETRKRTIYSPKSGRMRTIRVRVPAFSRLVNEERGAQGYHGGRAESLTNGPTELGTFEDFDLSAAYATILCLLRPLDYKGAWKASHIDDYTPDIMGVAEVKFKFPEGTRCPCLPVRDDNLLLWPLEGVSVCTAPEIYLAKTLGAEMEVLDGMIIPWASDVPLFESFTRFIQEQRDAARKGSLLAQIWKEIGNSLYGKIAQAVHASSVFDPKRGQHTRMPPSTITSSWFAAYITGVCRAVIGELMASIPQEYTLVSVTTDGFLTNAPESALRLDSTLCRMFAEVRQQVFGSPKFLEKKHTVGQVIAIKSRGQITSEFIAGHDEPVLAKAGVKPNVPKAEHNDYMLRLYLDREVGQVHRQSSLISLQEMWHTESDLVSIERDLTLNLEYDFKRRPVRPVERVVRGRPHLAFDTEPWRNAEQARDAIEHFRAFREKRLLKTLPDFLAWEGVMTVGPRVHKAGMNLRGGPAGILYRQFLRALKREEWGLSMKGGPGGVTRTHKDIEVWLMSRGIPAKADDLKNAGRDASKLADHTIWLNEETERLLWIIVEEFPEFDLERAIAPECVERAREVVRDLRAA
ncbi:hypothetical protein [Methylobacterium dankookense]|uniref:hypothetical protein n=1 Tax=Methylobacterium dankookense TaxID=560405 RepID=UPI00119F7820|nr:hypothetical protein [Methylobacterium dankookense]